jgi:adenylate cyclase
LLAIVAGSITALAIVAYEADLLRSLELSTINTRFQIRGPHKRPGNTVLVQVDEPTFGELPREQWPYRRGLHAQVIENIARDHPSVIAYDVQFSEASTLHEDAALSSAILNAGGRTVMATTETEKSGESRFLGASGGPLLHELGSRAANALFPTDPGGVDRRLTYEVGNLKTFAVVSAEVTRGRAVSRSLFGGHSAWIDYYGPAGTFGAVSFSTVLRGRLPRGFFHNKIVVVGASVPSLHDVAPTSTSSQMPGLEIQANAIETVLRGLPLRSLEAWVDLALIALMGVLVPAISTRTGPPLTIAVAVVVASILTVGAQLAFDGGRIVPFVYSAGALVLSTGGALSVQLITIAFERERVRDLFSRFVPENVVDEVLASADYGLRLGGVQREATVMFTDLRGFTSFAESLTPDQVIDVLNRYLSEMSDAILDHGGTLVAYMGDGIMAVFGAPIAQADHADRALAAAREMLTVRLPRFNEWLAEAGLGSGFRMGIGLNSGSVMSGNVGSERRVEYTAVGDTTNAAARIEQLTKGTPHQLMLSGATKEALREATGDLVFVRDVELRGRTAGTAIWSLPDARSPGTDEAPDAGADAAPTSRR